MSQAASPVDAIFNPTPASRWTVSTWSVQSEAYAISDGLYVSMTVILNLLQSSSIDPGDWSTSSYPFEITGLYSISENTASWPPNTAILSSAFVPDTWPAWLANAPANGLPKVSPGAVPATVAPSTTQSISPAPTTTPGGGDQGSVPNGQQIISSAGPASSESLAVEIAVPIAVLLAALAIVVTSWWLWRKRQERRRRLLGLPGWFVKNEETADDSTEDPSYEMRGMHLEDHNEVDPAYSTHGKPEGPFESPPMPWYGGIRPMDSFEMPVDRDPEELDSKVIGPRRSELFGDMGLVGLGLRRSVERKPIMADEDLDEDLDSPEGEITERPSRVRWQ